MVFEVIRPVDISRGFIEKRRGPQAQIGVGGLQYLEVRAIKRN